MCRGVIGSELFTRMEVMWFNLVQVRRTVEPVMGLDVAMRRHLAWLRSGHFHPICWAFLYIKGLCQPGTHPSFCLFWKEGSVREQLLSKNHLLSLSSVPIP